MTIEKEKIEAIKRDIDLVGLIESKGIPLKKNGKGYKGLCPFHDDKTPSLSVNPETNLWNCFGCNKGGDVFTFEQEYEHVDFPQAVSQLSVISDQFPVKKKPSSVHPAPCITLKRDLRPVQELKLLGKVLSYYQHSFNEDGRGLRYLNEERGITDPQSFKDFGVGYVNGNLL
jgi:DNA primase